MDIILVVCKVLSLVFCAGSIVVMAINTDKMKKLIDSGKIDRAKFNKMKDLNKKMLWVIVMSLWIFVFLMVVYK